MRLAAEKWKCRLLEGNIGWGLNEGNRGWGLLEGNRRWGLLEGNWGWGLLEGNRGWGLKEGNWARAFVLCREVEESQKPLRCAPACVYVCLRVVSVKGNINNISQISADYCVYQYCLPSHVRSFVIRWCKRSNAIIFKSATASSLNCYIWQHCDTVQRKKWYLGSENWFSLIINLWILRGLSFQTFMLIHRSTTHDDLGKIWNTSSCWIWLFEIWSFWNFVWIFNAKSFCIDTSVSSESVIYTTFWQLILKCTYEENRSSESKIQIVF